MDHASPYGIPAARLAALASVSPRTARRWKARGRVPPVVGTLLASCDDLGALDPAWAGFTLRAGQLWTPENDGYAPGDVRAIPYRAAQLADALARLRGPQQYRLL